MVSPEEYNNNFELLEAALQSIESQKKLAVLANIDESTLSKALSFSTVYCKILPLIGLKFCESHQIPVDPEYLAALKTVLKKEINPCTHP